MGRAPCCDKASVKKGPWSPEEDAKLKAYIEANGTGGNWIALPQKIGLKRCGKSCRLRWLNYLRPNIKHGGFSEEEDNIICSLYISIGSRWSIIAAQLPGRTDNDIKNYWNTKLKKKLLGKQRKEQQARRAAAAAGATCLAHAHAHAHLKQEQMILKSESSESHYMNSTSTSCVPGMVSLSQTPYWPQLPAAVVIPPPTTGPQGQGQGQDPAVAAHLINHQEYSSIKNLLLKLGGRFSDTDHNPMMNVGYSLDQYHHVSFAQDHGQMMYPYHAYESSMNNMINISSSSAISPPITSSSTQFNVNEQAATTTTTSNNSSNMFELGGVDDDQGFPAELSELIYGLEGGLYGTEHSYNMVDGHGSGSGSSSCTGSSSVESSSWGDLTSLAAYPPITMTTHASASASASAGFEASKHLQLQSQSQTQRQIQSMPQVISTFDIESSYFAPQ